MQRDFSKLIGQNFDLLVCGGGIYGAWTAYDAALRGLKVALVDQGDWACATSSSSSKLIHGGLRYLEALDIKLVKKALAERQMLLQVAPHRVWPLRFGIPVYKGGRLNGLRLKMGLVLYDFLAGTLYTGLAHHYFDSKAFSTHFACLKPTTLSNGYTYLDAQTDDARFTLELVDGALAAGAVCVNYCKVTHLIESGGQVCGATVHSPVDNKTVTLSARQVVNTTGQWIGQLQAGQPGYKLAKGVHLILPKVLDDDALLLTAHSDGRVFFMIPWYGLTLLGTTDTFYDGDVNQVKMEEADVDYLLAEANRVLQPVQWQKSDIIGQYAGLRVLRQSAKATPSALSRDWELHIADNGLLSSIGGKFTSAREDASQIINAVCQRLNVNLPCKTEGRAFPWKPEGDYALWLTQTLATAHNLHIEEAIAQWLVKRYGKKISLIFQLITDDPGLAKRITPTLPFIAAELIFCARHEMTIHLEDLLRRRIPLFILAKLTASEWQAIFDMAAKNLGWNADKLAHEVALCRSKAIFMDACS